MTAAPLDIPTENALRLFLVDEDPVFRLGLRIWLEQRPEFAIAGEASGGEETLAQVATLRSAAMASAIDAAASPRAGVDLVIVDLGLGTGDPTQLSGLALCRDLKQQFPDLPVLVISAQVEPVLAAAATAMGADGFGMRGLPVRDLAILIRRTAQGGASTSGVAPPLGTNPRWDPLAPLRDSCLQQIETAIAAIETEQAQAPARWYNAVLQGRHRELRAARWMVQRILPSLEVPSPGSVFTPETAPSVAPIVPAPGAVPLTLDPVRTRVCEAVFQKLHTPLENHTELPLEIDILRLEKRQELLYLLLRAFEEMLDDLRQGQVQAPDLPAQVPQLLQDLWLKGLMEFFGRYYTPAESSLDRPLVVVLQEEAETVGQGLGLIPGVQELLGHLLFQSTLVVEGTAHMATTPTALRRSQLLLENLLIQLACGVIQPLLNRCADLEDCKRTLYQRRMVSSRDIARFRNDLSWRYRWQQWVAEPRAIFESRQQLLYFSPQGIQAQWVYAPRQEELAKLTGVQYTLTLALEARDAIAPRLQMAIAWVGSGVVYVLTEVVGRGIGLVGRGILKGIGSAWQETRLRQRSRDEA